MNPSTFLWLTLLTKTKTNPSFLKSISIQIAIAAFKADLASLYKHQANPSLRYKKHNNSMNKTFTSALFAKASQKVKTSKLLILLFLLATAASAQNQFFAEVQPSTNVQAREAVQAVKNKKVFRISEQAMRSYLVGAKLEFKNNGVTLPLEIPLPDGTTEIFNIVESPILAPAIAAANPDIKTYTGNGSIDKKSIIRFSVTSLGFSAIILRGGGDAIYFESYSKQDPSLLFSYFGSNALVPEGKSLAGRCGTGNAPLGSSAKVAGSGVSQKNTGAVLRTFRIAVASTGEFTAQNGGTQAGALAKITNYVNNMTAVYRNELSVSFVLVSGTNVIYTNAATDPYNNANQSGMLIENHNNLTTVIGTANFDIGHVWGTAAGSGGGIATPQSVCDASIKGRGVSGEGDGSYSQIFNDQLFLHEVGHQFGMNHSYNSSIPVCTTRNQETSVEPGAGATIMSYGFTCDGDDYFTSTQIGPFLNFHTVNYDEAEAYISNPTPGFGNCFVGTATSNTPPVVTVPGAFTIPKSTPFALTGSATDANGDAMTYSWEGTNVGTVAAPDAATLANTALPPFFRSYPPVTTATRTFPLLSAILNGSNYAKGDKLPSVSFVTTHRLVVRDNNAAGGGLNYENVTVTVDGNIGPFLETTNLSATYPALSSQTITWSVNGTDAATPNVKISLSTDGGLTFPTVLVASTPNDGSEAITLPNIATTTARIKVEAVGNIFFDISNADFTIGSVLSVNLLDFNVTLQEKNNAFVTWKTTNEVNLKGFEVEISKSSPTAFQKNNFVVGKGTVLGGNYEMVVPNLLPGTYYFRLKSLDTDGKFKYSDIKKLVINDGSNFISIYPNPSQDGRFKVELPGVTNKNITVKIINSIGQVISTSGKINYSSPVDMQIKAGAGTYIVEVIMPDGSSVFKKLISLN